MAKSQKSLSNKSPFSEARRMIANELYVPSKWGKVTVDNSGIDPKIIYEENTTKLESQKQDNKES